MNALASIGPGWRARAADTFAPLLLICLWVVALPGQSAELLVAMNTDDDALRAQLLSALESRGDDYEPRTEHLADDGSPEFLNRLILEDSPYLLQHAHNPVNWYPWGDEAFAVARAEDKPVFLSIGYATCHWCHVMERESFENLAIAAQLNADFIAIKVDREQLPDVDAFYMTGVMMVSGRGGWPMSSFIDADGRPFFGATYFPPDDFMNLLVRVDELWRSERQTLLDQADQIASAIAASNALGKTARDVGNTTIEEARRVVLSDVDELEGGFGDAPKFPREPTLFFLLDQAARNDDDVAFTVVDEALRAMAAGGIHDQIGGGFHRYSVDSGWQVPHFEKMLYNQAALARLYAQAAEWGGDVEHARTARRILDYVLSEMSSPEGLFYSATDADSEGEEGRYFVWTPAEIDAVLGPEEAAMAKAVWSVSDEGNFEGRNILHTEEPLADLAASQKLTSAELLTRIDRWSTAMHAARVTREAPLRDEKQLTAWNGMMIMALAEGSERLGEPRYLDAAYRAADVLWRTMSVDDGTGLYRARFEGRSSIEGTQPDYAYLAEAFVTLYDISGETRWLTRATTLTDAMIDRFRDPLEGGFFMGAASVAGARLATRPKDLQDNAIASGNSVALRTLARLATRTGEPRFVEEADALIAALSAPATRYPTGFLYLLTGVSEHLYGAAGALRYAARGKIKAQGGVEDGRLVVRLNVAHGWHVNAHEPLQDYLIPTTLIGAEGLALDDVRYPEPEVRALSFQREPLALHEGELILSAAMPVLDDGQRTLSMELGLQACSDEVCLAPENLRLRVLLNRVSK